MKYDGGFQERKRETPAKKELTKFFMQRRNYLCY